jgi:hypothetical protein
VYRDRILALHVDRYVESGSQERSYTRLELAEETGIEMETLISLGSFMCNAALQNNRVHTYLAFPVSPIPAFKSSEGDAILLSPAEWLSDPFLAVNGNLFSTAALSLAKRYVDR